MLAPTCINRLARALRAAVPAVLLASALASGHSASAASLESGTQPPPSSKPAPTKDAGPFDAAVHFPLVTGAYWRYTLDGTPFRVTVEDDARRIAGVRTRVLRASTDAFSSSYTADHDGLRLHQELDDNGDSATFSPPAVLVEQGAKTGAVNSRTGEVAFSFGRERFTLNYDTRSEVLGTEQVAVGGRTLAAIRVRTDIAIYGSVEGVPVSFGQRTERWLARHVGMVRVISEQDGATFTSTLDFAFVDADGDGVSAPDDNCVSAANREQRDTDRDGDGDACDLDDDNDGVPDATDAFPIDPREQADADGDGSGNNADRDDDNDRLPDSYEVRFGLDPLDPADARRDHDGDGLDTLSEYELGRSPRLNEATLLPVLLDILLD